MNILIADKVSDKMVRDIEELGAKVSYQPELTAEALPDAVDDVVVLIVRSTKVTAETLAAASKLRLIIRAGAGVNTIALDAASDRGVSVANCPGMNADAVAELAVGLVLAADRGIADATAALRDGKWLKSQFGKGHGLLGRTLGVVGLGQIGRGTARRAQALGMHVVAWSRSLTPDQAESLGVEYAPDPIALAKKSDAVSVHLAATAETKHLLSKEFFDALKPGAIFVNTARGPVVDTEALIKAIDEKQLRAGLDVYEDEPTGGKNDFPHTDLAKRITCTPHIGASTAQASEAIAAETVRIVKTFIRTGQAINIVNICPPADDKTHLVVRHYNRVGVLARILTVLRDEGINVEAMQNSLFQTGTAASCCLVLDKAPAEATIKMIQNDEAVIGAAQTSAE